MLQSANPFRYEYMAPPKISEVLKSCPVAIQPSGLLEWHGDHNAIGLDGLKGYYICERAITLLGGGALMPVNWIGTYGYIRYPGTVCYDAETTKNVFVQIFRELVKIGFRVVFLLTGHYGQWQVETLDSALEEVRRDFAIKGECVKIIGLRPPDLVLHLFRGDHAREWETSMLWATARAWGVDLVDVSGFSLGPEDVPKYPIDDPKVPMREPDIWDWPTDLRDPTVCSPDKGDDVIDAIARGMVCEIVDALDELGIPYTPPGGAVSPPL